MNRSNAGGLIPRIAPISSQLVVRYITKCGLGMHEIRHCLEFP